MADTHGENEAPPVESSASPPPPPPEQPSSKQRRISVMRQMVEITQSEDLEQLYAFSDYVVERLEKIYGSNADN